jgi:hypothetical protein
MIYIDSPCNGWCHLVASDINTLHLFATKLGVKRCWYQNKQGKYQPHYDLKDSLLLTANKKRSGKGITE